MSNERGDFKWVGDEVVWESSEKGSLTIHPILGPVPFDSPFANCIISRGLAEDIDKALKDKLKNI